jgi:predicted transcriptional regulator
MEPTRQPEWLRSTKGTAFTGIGSLEAEILAVIWEQGETTVREVYETLRERRQIAYTTVMTVMNNLVKKHLLTQDRSAIAYVYKPAIPGRTVAQTVLESVIDRLLDGQTNVAVSQLLGLERDLTPEQLDELRSYALERQAR